MNKCNCNFYKFYVVKKPSSIYAYTGKCLKNYHDLYGVILINDTICDVENILPFPM